MLYLLSAGLTVSRWYRPDAGFRPRSRTPLAIQAFAANTEKTQNARPGMRHHVNRYPRAQSSAGGGQDTTGLSRTPRSEGAYHMLRGCDGPARSGRKEP